MFSNEMRNSLHTAGAWYLDSESEDIWTIYF